MGFGLFFPLFLFLEQHELYRRGYSTLGRVAATASVSVGAMVLSVLGIFLGLARIGIL